MVEIVQLILVFTILGSAFFVFLTKKLVHACFAVFITFISIAGLYITFSADFVGVSQIIIYVGGILILFLFGVFINKKSGNEIMIENDWNFLSITTSVFISILLFLINYELIHKTGNGNLTGSQVQNIGLELITNQILPFEIIGIILLIALIGTTYIASQKK